MNKKKFYIAVDLEGVACTVGNYERGLSAGEQLDFASLQGTRESGAAAKALFDNGAEEVYIWDNHGTGVNLKYEILDKRCKIVMGAGSRLRFPDIDDSFDGILMIGYHAYDTAQATLAHVYSSSTYQSMKINSVSVGEMQIDAAIAGKHGVPLVFASGDNICMAQARASFEGLVTVQTKKALAWNSCISKHPMAVCEEIYEAVSKIVEKPIDVKPYIINEPFEYEVRYKRIEYAQGSVLRNPDNTRFELSDVYTRRGTLNRLEDIFEF